MKTLAKVLAKVLAAVILSAAIFAGAAAGSPPPSIPVQIGATHAQPVAGHSFTGITVTNIGRKISVVNCDATIGHKTLHAQRLRFYADFGVDGPAAVTCAWSIPAGAHGKQLAASVEVLVGGDRTTVVGPGTYRWRIR